MIVLEITDKSNSIQFLDLRDLLQLIADRGLSLKWRVLSFDGVTRPNAKINYERIQKLIVPPSGWELSWGELIDLGESIHQSYWCSIHGDESIVIEAQDSSRWVLATADLSLVQRVYDRFSNVALCALTDLEYQPGHHGSLHG
jgi:hypothetical protein